MNANTASQRTHRPTRHPLGLATVLLTLVFSSAGISATAGPAPDQTMRSAADRIIYELDNRRDEFERNPAEFNRLVEAQLSPHFDLDAISEAALGRYRRQATPEQYARFREAFGRMLLRNYSSVMRGYRNEPMEWLPARVSGDGAEAIAGFVLRRTDGSPPLPVSFRLHQRDGQWRVYDISVENVGLISTYRGSFLPELKKSGIDGLTARIESKLGQ